MRKSVPLVVLTSAIALAGNAISPRAQSASNISWQTSFDCPDWSQPNGLNEADVCNVGDNIAGWGGWTTASGRVDQITSAANSPLGTGKGFRHWRGGANTTDNRIGQNNNGGGIRIDLPTGPKQVWVRYYMRYQQGFAWQYINYTKELYFNAGGSQSTSYNLSFTTAFVGWDAYGSSVVYPTSQNIHAAPGWTTTMGGQVADGRWHYYEVHVNTATGVLENWIDGRPSGRSTSANLANAPLVFILVGSNQCCVAIQPDMYTDYDDIAISFTGYIGPIGGSSSSSGPSAPTNLRVTS